MRYLRKLLIILIVILSVKNFNYAQEKTKQDIKSPTIYSFGINKYVLVSDYNQSVRDFNACRELLIENQKALDDYNRIIKDLKIASDTNWNYYIYCVIGGAILGGIATYKLK